MYTIGWAVFIGDLVLCTGGGLREMTNNEARYRELESECATRRDRQKYLMIAFDDIGETGVLESKRVSGHI